VFFSTHDRDDDSYATMLFPFEIADHPARLFSALAEPQVCNGCIDVMSNREPRPEDVSFRSFRMLMAESTGNNIADHIIPALNAPFMPMHL